MISVSMPISSRKARGKTMRLGGIIIATVAASAIMSLTFRTNPIRGHTDHHTIITVIEKEAEMTTINPGSVGDEEVLYNNTSYSYRLEQSG